LIAVENNEENQSDGLKKIPAGKVSLIGYKFSKMTKRKNKSMNEVKLKIEKKTRFICLTLKLQQMDEMD
jgi:hypothetical protein